MDASIAQEFYKVREEWEKVDTIQSWRLAVWQAEYADVDIIDKFLEIERSPIGIFADLFFRFESYYPGNNDEFTKLLWEEYLHWFTPSTGSKYDIMLALRQAELVTEDYVPDATLEPTITNLWLEISRLRSYIKDFDAHFVFYFPIVPFNKHNISQWFQEIIPTVPHGIRLITMDFAQDKKLHFRNKEVKGKVIAVILDLKMTEAIKNEMMKGGLQNNTVDVDARFRRQVIVLMDTTLVPHNPKMKDEARKLLAICAEINTADALISGFLIVGQVYYSNGSHQEAGFYIDKAIARAEEEMEQHPNSYHSWKMCMMIKASIKTAEKEYQQAIALYDTLAEKATDMQDVYYTMEARRSVAHIYYEKNQLDESFEHLLLALFAGSYLDLELRRNSVFLHAAYLTLDIGMKIRTKEDVEIVEKQLAAWLGEDWRALLAQEGVSNVKIKRKKKLHIF